MRKEKQERAEEYVDSGLSKRVLQLAKERRDEIADECAAATAIGVDAFLERTAAAPARFQVRQEEQESDEGEFEDDGFEKDVDEGSSIGSCARTDSRSPPRSWRTRGDAFWSGRGNAQDDAPALPPKVVDVYTKYALLVLMRYVGVGFMADGSHAVTESCSRDMNPESCRRRSRSSRRCGIRRRYYSSDQTSGRRMRATRRQSCLLRRSRRRLRSKSVFSARARARVCVCVRTVHWTDDAADSCPRRSRE